MGDRRSYSESLEFQHDLADRVDWYELEQQVPPELVQRFLNVIEQTRERLLEWPESGRTVEGSLQGLQELNLPRPFQHYVLLFVGTDRRLRFLRLLHAAQERQAAIERYQENPDEFDEA